MFTKHNFLRILTILAVLAVLVFSTQEALANFSNGPENPGPIVVRGEIEDFGIWFPEPISGLGVIINGDVVEFCDTGTEFDLMPFQDIMIPSDADRIIELVQGDDIPTTVWPFTDFDCGLFTTVDPIAYGTVDLVLTDNDVFAFDSHETPNMNAFTFKAHGKLTWTEGGGVAHINMLSNCVWDGYWPPEKFKCKDKINLH